MFTDNDKRELKRLMQKRRRALPTGTRRSMLLWSNGEKGKRAKEKWLSNGGREIVEARRSAGGAWAEEKIKKNKESIRTAEKHRNEWTAKEEADLLEMSKQGKTTKEIAYALSRSLRAIERKKAKLKASNA